MPELQENAFLIRLYEIISKLSGIARTQTFRLQQKWESLFHNADIKPHYVREFKLDKDKFISDLSYRINALKLVTNAVRDGFYSIKSILEGFFNSFFNSEAFKKEFSEEDQLILQYLIAKEILGNLIQYNKMDHETIPLKYNIMARNYTMMKLKKVDDKDIQENMNKIFGDKNLDIKTIQSVMKEIEKDGLITIISEGDINSYQIKKDLVLSPDAEKKYNQELFPLVSWPTNFWRSFYNIRELNITPGSDIRYREFLEKILSRAATQGFGPTDFVFKNLIKYYEKIQTEN